MPLCPFSPFFLSFFFACDNIIPSLFTCKDFLWCPSSLAWMQTLSGCGQDLSGISYTEEIPCSFVWQCDVDKTVWTQTQVWSQFHLQFCSVLIWSWFKLSQCWTVLQIFHKSLQRLYHIFRIYYELFKYGTHFSLNAVVKILDSLNNDEMKIIIMYKNV